MKVSELIELLKDMPPDALVITDSYPSNYIALGVAERCPAKKLPHRSGTEKKYAITSRGDIDAVYLGVDALVASTLEWEKWEDENNTQKP